MRQQSLKKSPTGDASGEPSHRLSTVSDDMAADAFDSDAYGENQVAALQSLLYGRFAESGTPQDDVPERISRTERVVAVVSRAGGIVALVAVLAGVVAVIF